MHPSIRRAARTILSPRLYRQLRQEKISDLVTDAEARRRWSRARFLERASRFVPALGVDDHRGNRYYVSPRDLDIGRYLFLHGQYDAAMLDNALSVLADRGFTPSRFLDIGANIGTTTIELLSRFPGTTADAFEPDPANVALLAQNVLANGLQSRVNIHQMALSDRDGQVEFERSPENPGDHRVRVGPPASGRFDESDRETCMVEARRLDTLCDQGRLVIDASTLVCLDVQGHEAQVLAGASRIFAVGAPIALEFWPYGLDRAGGYHQLLELLGRYPDILDISKAVRVVKHEELSRLRDRLDGQMPDYAELLVTSGPGPADSEDDAADAP